MTDIYTYHIYTNTCILSYRVYVWEAAAGVRELQYVQQYWEKLQSLMILEQIRQPNIQQFQNYYFFPPF